MKRSSLNASAIRRGENIWRDMTDEEIIEALAGREITWVNTMSEKRESARLPAHDAKLTRVTRGVRSDGRKIRCIEFVSAGAEGGFLAVRLRAIRKVE